MPKTVLTTSLKTSQLRGLVLCLLCGLSKQVLPMGVRYWFITTNKTRIKVWLQVINPFINYICNPLFAALNAAFVKYRRIIWSNLLAGIMSIARAGLRCLSVCCDSHHLILSVGSAYDTAPRFQDCQGLFSSTKNPHISGLSVVLVVWANCEA